MLGSYRGVRWVRSRHCDMFPFRDRLLRSEWYFVCGSDGEPTGDHFRTMREMEDWIDSEQDALLCEPGEAHAGSPECVCTDGLGEYRDISSCCDSPIDPIFDSAMVADGHSIDH